MEFQRLQILVAMYRFAAVTISAPTQRFVLWVGIKTVFLNAGNARRS